LQRSDIYALNKASYYTQLFSSILSDAHNPRENWEERFCAYGYNLKADKYIIAVALQDALKSGITPDGIGKALLSVFQNSIYVIQDERIILFFSTHPDAPLDDETLDSWNEFISHNNLKVGVSSKFNSLTDLKIHMAEAKSAIRVGEKVSLWKKLFLYDDYRLYHMALNLSSGSNSMILCYPPLVRLLETDAGNSMQLGYTLYVYLTYPKSPATACEKLHIHKNTLYFRLEKIRSIMGTDLESAPVVTQIMLSFLILKSKNLIGWDLFSPTEHGKGPKI
jgi:sugar diacid utilization regulator